MIRTKKFWLNMLLGLAGIVSAVLHGFCEDSCLYLKGDFFGFALDYLGIAYMCSLIISYLLRNKSVFLLLLSFGIGGEIYLVGFQVNHGIYCSYCLLFGAFLFLMFLLNFEWSKKAFIAAGLLTGFLIFSVFFEGSATPVYADEIPLSSFGKGPVQVRLYTDYFCGPCRALEPKLEPTIRSLVKKGVISITFIDTPVHPQTALYARLFLYALNQNRSFDEALRARSVLFSASRQKIKDKDQLEAFVTGMGIKIKPFDTRPVFAVFSGFLKEDAINATPTCVIYRDDKKEKVTGSEILNALERLL